MLYQVHLALAGIELTTVVVVGTDYIGSSKIQQPYLQKKQQQKTKKSIDFKYSTQ